MSATEPPRTPEELARLGAEVFDRRVRPAAARGRRQVRCHRCREWRVRDRPGRLRGRDAVAGAGAAADVWLARAGSRPPAGSGSVDDPRRGERPAGGGRPAAGAAGRAGRGRRGRGHRHRVHLCTHPLAGRRGRARAGPAVRRQCRCWPTGRSARSTSTPPRSTGVAPGGRSWCRSSGRRHCWACGCWRVTSCGSRWCRVASWRSRPYRKTNANLYPHPPRRRAAAARRAGPLEGAEAGRRRASSARRSASATGTSTRACDYGNEAEVGDGIRAALADRALPPRRPVGHVEAVEHLPRPRSTSARPSSGPCATCSSTTSTCT